MQKMRKKWSVIIVLVIAMLLVGCFPLQLVETPSSWREGWQVPEDGLWYCADLQVQLCLGLPFDKELQEAHQNNEHYSYVMKNGQLFMCAVERAWKTYDINLTHQELTDMENLGISLMMLKSVEVGEDTFIVQDESGKECVFTRIPYFSITDYLSQWEETEPIANVGDLRYVGHVLERAELMGETAYADAQISQEALTVSFDPSSDCWLVGCPVGTGEDQTILMGLVRRNGDVLSVWQE